MDEHGSSYKVAKEQKSHVPIDGNIAYGQVKKEEGVGDSVYKEPIYETVPT